jgi:alpha-aminoadipic semialdehyde synthase
VDNLPCELPRDASHDFSVVLKKFVPDIVGADYTGRFEDCALPEEIKRAVITYRGELTPQYTYLQENIS